MEEIKYISKTWIAAIVIIVLLAGFYAGFYYGETKGNEEERTTLLLEQKATAEQELLDQVSPFIETDISTNPFEGATVNPFAQ